VRQDLGLEYAGEKALLIEDQSPFQIGTEGKIDGLRFTLLGRLRFKWEQGLWDEWFAWNDDGQTCWLADAQGFLSFYRELHALKQEGLGAENWQAGDSVEIAGKTWGVKDIKRVSLDSAMGEIPLLAKQNRKSLSIDLTGDGEECATVEKGPEGVRVYVGRMYDFENFDFKNLRELDGW
jgi:hypothetical protein